jgi:STE24 endopeptidase
VTIAAIIILVLVIAKTAVQIWLESLNQSHVAAHSQGVPEAFKDIVDEPTYARSVQYTLAKSRLARLDSLYHAVIL